MKKPEITPIKMKGARGAFTLVEILIVIGILILLMGMTTQMLSGVGQAQGRARAKTDMALIASGLEAFSGLYGGYPRVTSSGGLDTAATKEKDGAGDIYKCLIGKMSMRLKEGDIIMADLGTARKPFIDTSKLKIADPEDPAITDVDPEKNGVFFCDHWREPYLYFYDTTTSTLNEETRTWRAPGYILLCKGPDKKAKEVGSMYSTGLIPDSLEYLEPEENIDNIIHGREE